MKLIHLPDPARRAVLAALGGMVAMFADGGAAAGRTSGASPRPGKWEMRKVEDEYRRLIPLWQAERQRLLASSNTYDYWKGPHGKAIVSLGPAIIPHLIQELRKGDILFNVPLALITKVDIANGEYVSEQANSALWLKWWDNAKA
jgi:hypothetical protein